MLPVLAAALVAGGGVSTGCGTGRDLGMSDSTYVAAMGALERLERDAASPPTRAQRDSVLRANGVTADQLERAADVLSLQPTRASELWRAIDRRSREPVE